MNRREAVQRITFLLGGAISAPLMAGIAGERLNFGPSLAVSDQQEALLAEVADVIIPTTGTPGAKAAGAEKFIVRVMRDCYVMEDQKKFYDGLAKVDALVKKPIPKTSPPWTPLRRTTSLKRPPFPISLFSCK